MNLRNWSKQHTLGLLLGVLTTLIAIPIVLFIFSLTTNKDFSTMWHKFMQFRLEKSKIISLASILNLLWFHIFIRKENYPVAMGVIMATVLNLGIIIYFKFIAS
jgi:hypothetical protein